MLRGTRREHVTVAAGGPSTGHLAVTTRRPELLGRNVFSQLNHYLLLVTVDIGNPGIEGRLSAMLPQGTQISVVGEFTPLKEWPEPKR